MSDGNDQEKGDLAATTGPVPSPASEPTVAIEHTIRTAYLSHMTYAMSESAGDIAISEEIMTVITLRGAYIKHLSDEGTGSLSGDDVPGNLLCSVYATRIGVMPEYGALNKRTAKAARQTKKVAHAAPHKHKKTKTRLKRAKGTTAKR